MMLNVLKSTLLSSVLLCLVNMLILSLFGWDRYCGIEIGVLNDVNVVLLVEF